MGEEKKWKHICHENKDVTCRTGLKDLDQRLQNGPSWCLYQASNFIGIVFIIVFVPISQLDIGQFQI